MPDPIDGPSTNVPVVRPAENESEVATGGTKVRCHSVSWDGSPNPLQFWRPDHAHPLHLPASGRRILRTCTRHGRPEAPGARRLSPDLDARRSDQGSAQVRVDARTDGRSPLSRAARSKEDARSHRPP